MYRHNVAYRFNNREVQGFSGYAFNKNRAVQDAEAKIRYKLTIIGEKFYTENIITSFNGLDKQEIDLIKKDWKSQ